MSHMFIKYWSSEAILEVVMGKKVEGEQDTFGKSLVLTTGNDTRNIFLFPGAVELLHISYHTMCKIGKMEEI